MGQMRFELDNRIVLQALTQEVVVLSEKPDGGDQFQARHVPRGKRSEMEFEGKGETAIPAV